MKKILIFLLSVVLLVSCDFEKDITSGFAENPFLVRNRIDTEHPYDGQGNIMFLAFTDVHVREEDKDEKVIHYYDNLNSFLETTSCEFALDAGDLSHNGEALEEVWNFVNDVKSGTVQKQYILATGNHDRKTYDDYFSINIFHTINCGIFKKHNHTPLADSLQTMGCYVYGDNVLSVYVLDSSKNTFGRKQLDWFEQALRSDQSRYKIILTHENLVSGKKFNNNSLFMTGFGDIGEINRLHNIMYKYDVRLILNGHTHACNYIYRSKDGRINEFNMGAFQRKDTIFESRGFWYTVILDTENNLFTIRCHEASSGNISSEWTV